MSALAQLLRPRAAITNSQELAEHIRGGGLPTDSGALVNEDTAMRVATVYACVRVLAESIAFLPLVVYKRLERGKERATKHWAYRLLHDEPNPWQTSFEFREMMQAHVTLSGNAYALKTVVGNEVRELLPVPPGRVTVKQGPDYRVSYEVRMPDGRPMPVPAERMFHLPGLSFDGIKGLNPIQYQREAIGVAMQLVRHEARFFKYGASIAGVLEHPNLLDEEAAKRLQESFDEKYAGANNAHKTILLEEGMKFSKTGVSFRDAQFIEAQKFSRSEIAALFRMQPHKIGDLERATFSNIEHQGIEHVVDTLGPWLARWERRITKSLIPEAERGTIFAEFLVDALLRGDTTARFQSYQVAVQTGWMSRNEVREKENMNPEQGLDEFLTPAHITGSDPAKPPATPPAAAFTKPQPPVDEEEDDAPQEP